MLDLIEKSEFRGPLTTINLDTLKSTGSMENNSFLIPNNSTNTRIQIEEDPSSGYRWSLEQNHCGYRFLEIDSRFIPGNSGMYNFPGIR